MGGEEEIEGYGKVKEMEEDENQEDVERREWKGKIVKRKSKGSKWEECNEGTREGENV